MINFLNKHLRGPSPLEIISKELAQAHIDRLEAENTVEYATAVLELNLARIERLNTRIKEYK